jgi:hypothetical protein
MACLRSTGVYSPEQREKIGSVMGKMKVVFTGDTAVSEPDDHNTSEPFKIAEQEAGHIVILTNLAEEPVRNRIEFASDGCWPVNPSGKKPYRENSEEFPEAGNYL